MSRPVSLPVSLPVFLLILLSGSHSALAESPLKRTRSLIEAFQRVVVAPAGDRLTGDALTRTRSAVVTLDGLLDLEQIARVAFTPHLATLGDQEAPRLQKVFVQVVRLNAYRSAGDLLRRRQVRYEAGTGGATDATVLVQVNDTGDDEALEIGFNWALVGGVWRVADVAFDGDSLVKDYQNQFGRILRKEGVKGLARRLDERLAKELTERGPLP